MIKKLSFTILLALLLLLSISSIQASDVDTLNQSEDMSLQPDDDVQLEIGDDASGQSEKNQTQLTPKTSKIYYNGNYQVTLSDSQSNRPLAGKAVSFTVDGVNYTANTNSKGIAGINLKLNPGSYLAGAYFAGDDTLNASTFTGTVKVVTTLKAKDITKYYKGSKNYKAKYLDSNGNALKNRKVAIKVDGKKYKVRTDSKGIASLAVDLKPGTYKIVTANPVTKQKATTTFTVLTTIYAENVKKVKGDGKNFIAQFLKKNGKALAKKQVKININGTNYTYTTDSNGMVKVSMDSFSKGKYKVICYNLDGLSKANTVKIYKNATTKLTSDDYTFLANGTNIINVKFQTSLGGDSNVAKKIRIFIDGIPYSAKTDSNGEINFTLPSLKAGVHDLDCEFTGEKFFKYSHSHNYLTIIKTPESQFSIDGTTSFGNYAGTPFSLFLTSGKVPLIKRTVSFSVNGKNYTNTTNYYGYVSIPINLDVGEYVVSYRFEGDSTVNAAEGTTNITVFERINTVISGNYKTSYADTVQSFNVYLKDSNGNPMAGEYIELIIGDETYTEKTNSEGYALVKTSAPVGKYSVTIRFNGNNNYNSSSKSGTTTVTLSKYAKGINEKNGTASKAYLKETKNCQVNNEKIKTLAANLTKGLTSDLDKAKAIFSYVQLYIEYEYYYDTQKGAVKTLTSGEGNAADHSHLLIALYRAAGLKARYVHGDCYFYMDGKTHGHVWTQVLIDGTWICADSSDLANKFGYIYNWNMDNYTFKNTYLELPF